MNARLAGGRLKARMRVEEADKIVRRRTQARGYVLITMMAGMVFLLSAVGLAIDTGYLQLVKIRMQTAADAAALGGVNEGKQNGGGIEDAARADAAANGFLNGAGNVTVAVNHPPSSGYYTSDSAAVEVVIVKQVQPLFLSVLGFGSMPVRARAVARLGAGTDCIYILDPSASQAMTASGGADVHASCGIMIDSSSSSALKISGGADISASSVSIVGNYSSSGGATISPTPVTGVDPESDPLAYVPAPAVGGCDYTGYHLSGGKTDALTEGVYCNGIQLSGGAVVTLAPGTYILKGGGLKISGGSTLSGTGVTFYVTQGGGYSYDGVSFSGGTHISLSAPTAGPLAGMLFFQDRSVVSGSDTTISGGATSHCTGAFYFPTTELKYTGGSDSAYTILVAKQISFSGGSDFGNDYTSLPAGPPVKGHASLGE